MPSKYGFETREEAQQRQLRGEDVRVDEEEVARLDAKVRDILEDLCQAKGVAPSIRAFRQGNHYLWHAGPPFGERPAEVEVRLSQFAARSYVVVLLGTWGWGSAGAGQRIARVLAEATGLDTWIL